VYDGHGGELAAQYAADKFHILLANKLEEKKWNSTTNMRDRKNINLNQHFSEVGIINNNAGDIS
jgi:serine/threonine protein phosphatase PrpC